MYSIGSARVDLVDVDGHTALHWAALGGNAEVCQILMENGISPNVQVLKHIHKNLQTPSVSSWKHQDFNPSNYIFLCAKQAFSIKSLILTYSFNTTPLHLTVPVRTRQDALLCSALRMVATSPAWLSSWRTMLIPTYRIRRQGSFHSSTNPPTFLFMVYKLSYTTAV